MTILIIFGIIALLSWLIAYLIAFGDYLLFYKPSSYWLNKLLLPLLKNENTILKLMCLFVAIGVLSTIFIDGILLVKLMN